MKGNFLTKDVMTPLLECLDIAKIIDHGCYNLAGLVTTFYNYINLSVLA
jgi:hypothetical protein